MGIETWIWTLRQGFWPQGWNMGLKAGITASMLGCPPGWGFGLEAEGGDTKKEEEKKDKFLHM